MKLVGDVGGTKTLLALADSTGQLHHIARLADDDFADFDSLIRHYLHSQSIDVAVLTATCLAVAGPVNDSGTSATLTNRPWLIDSTALSQTFQIPPAKLINDFAGAAMGVVITPPSQLVPLQAGDPVHDGVRLVLGAGTGLGVATLLQHGNSWRVLPGEGGHIGFAPQNEQQDALCGWLRQAHGRVTNELLVSGMGLASIYAFLQGLAIDAPRTDPAQIAAAAQNGDALGLAAFDLFASVYGAVAGDLALMLTARGGVFLAGGIAAANLALMQRGAFIQAFNQKAGHSTLTQRMPVHIVTEPNLGLLGAGLSA